MPMLGVKDVDNYIKRQQRILITNAMRTNCQANRRVTMTSQSKAKKSTASRAGSKSRAAKTPAALAFLDPPYDQGLMTPALLGLKDKG